MVAIPGEAAAAPGGLSGAEGKALDIQRIEGASTDSEAFVEVAFRGNLEERLGIGGLKKGAVTIELRSDSGPATVITDRRSSRHPDEDRSGTPGAFALVRNGSTVVLLVEKLPAPVAEVAVTTSVGSGSAGAPARGEVKPITIDEKVEQIPWLQDKERIEIASESERRDRAEAEEDLEKTEKDIDKTDRNVGNAENAVNAADTTAEANAAKERLKRLREKLERLKRRRQVLEANLKVLDQWRDILFRLRNGLFVTQCSDFSDNDGDAAVDLADPGCRDAADNDEKDEPLPLSCPTPGGSRSPFAYINVPETNTASAIVLRKAGTGQPVLDAPVTGSSSPAQPVPGDICGAGIPVTWQYVVYTDGTPFSLPDPPPGHFGICVFIDADNPFGSGNPGGQDAAMSFGVATAPK